VFHEESDRGRSGWNPTCTGTPAWFEAPKSSLRFGPLTGPLGRRVHVIRDADPYWLVTVSSFQGSGAAGRYVTSHHPRCQSLSPRSRRPLSRRFRPPQEAKNAPCRSGGVRQTAEPSSWTTGYPIRLASLRCCFSKRLLQSKYLTSWKRHPIGYHRERCHAIEKSVFTRTILVTGAERAEPVCDGALRGR
jgi:hypothetical protein